MDLSQIVTWLKLPLGLLWGLLVACGLMLWGPHWFVLGLGLQSFIDTYRMYLGVVFLLFAVATVPRAIVYAAKWPLGIWEAKKAVRQRIARLADLSPQEKEVMRRFIDGDTKSTALNYADGVRTSLEAATLIYRASSVSQGGTRFAYNIQPWAWDHLREHPELLE